MQTSDQRVNAIESTLRNIKESIPVFFTRMAPSYFFKVKDTSCKLPLRTLDNMVVLCVSAIGFANAFVQGIERVFFFYVLFNFPLPPPCWLLMLLLGSLRINTGSCSKELSIGDSNKFLGVLILSVLCFSHAFLFAILILIADRSIACGSIRLQ